MEWMSSSMLLLILLNVIPPCFSEISILANPKIEIHPLPIDLGLRELLFLSCAVEPSTLDPNSDYISRWTFPSGRVLDSTSPVVAGPNVKHLLTQSPYTFGQALLPATLLIIRQLEYQDSGNYTCEAQNATDNTSSWVSDSVSLTLLVSVTTNENTVMTFDNETSVELSCEMSDYIRPNYQFQWFGPDNQRIDSGVTYSTGAIQTTPSGMNHTIRTQISTLTIANPESSHSGNYTCRVLGTDESAVIELIVMDTQSATTTTGTQTELNTEADAIDTSSTPNTTPSVPEEAANAIPLSVTLSLLAVLIFAGIIVTCIIIVVVRYRHNLNRQPTTKEETTDQDYDYPDFYDGCTIINTTNEQIEVKTNTAYATGGAVVQETPGESTEYENPDLERHVDSEAVRDTTEKIELKINAAYRNSSKPRIEDSDYEEVWNAT